MPESVGQLEARASEGADAAVRPNLIDLDSGAGSLAWGDGGAGPRAGRPLLATRWPGGGGEKFEGSALDGGGGGELFAFVDGYSDGAGNAYLWTITAGRSIITVHDPAGYSIDAIAFSPDGKILAAGDNVELFQPTSSTARTYLWNVHELS